MRVFGISIVTILLLVAAYWLGQKGLLGALPG